MGKEKRKTSQTQQIRVTTSAAHDIDEITNYIAFVKKQPITAVRVGDAILEVILKVSQSPHAYKECEAIPTKTKIYRQAACLSWLVIYKITISEIIILGIIHASRKASKIKKLRKIK